MARDRIRRAPLVLIVFVVLAAIAAGCSDAGSSTTDAANATFSCEHWCGNGSAEVTLGGTTVKISGGGCYDRGSEGIDARFGDWQDGSGPSYLALTAYRIGGSTPTPAIQLPGATATDHASPTVSGSLNGNTFILVTTVTLDAGGTGSFSGVDVNGSGPVKGTFNCG